MIRSRNRDKAIVIVVAACTCWLMYTLRALTIPLGISLLLAFLTFPMVLYLEKKLHISRKIPAAIVVGLISITILGLLIWLGPILVGQFQGFAKNLPEYLQTISSRTDFNVSEVFYSVLDKTPEESRAWATDIFAQPGKIWMVAKKFFSTATYTLFALVLVPIFWFIFTIHLDEIFAFPYRFIPHTYRQEVSATAAKINQTFMGFFRGRLLIVLIMGGMFSLGWWWAGVPYWFLVGMVTGLLNMVPYVSVVGLPIAIFMRYIEIDHQGQEIAFATIVVWPSLVYGVVQFIEGWILTPWIQGDQLDLSPGSVIVAVFVGGSFAGILGMLLAIPLAASLKIIAFDNIFPRLETWAAKV